MNELREQGLVSVNQYAINGDEFSEDGAFATRTSKEECGFLKIDGTPAAFTFTSGFGDGIYEAYTNGEAVSIELIEE